MKAARDPTGRMDAVDIISLKTIDGLKNIAARIPTVSATAAHCASSAAVPIAGLGQDFKGEGLQWVTLPPFSPCSAFISLWGFGLAKEIGGRLVMHSPEPELEVELDLIVARHGIWGLDGVYGGHEGQSVHKNLEVAKSEFEISVAQDPGHLSGAPQWVIDDLTVTRQIRVKQSKKSGVKTGGYVSASEYVQRGPSA